MLSARLRTALSYGGSFVLAGLLMWLALRSVSLEALGSTLAEADYTLLPLLAALLLLSHVLRAWRWRLLLQGLGDGRTAPTTRTAFGALMIGYMVNYGAPRLGEVARTAAVTRRTGTPFAAVFGTVVLERLLDVAMLGLGLLSVLVLLSDRLSALASLIEVPLQDRVSWPVLLVSSLLAVAVALGVWRLIRAQLRRPEGFLARRVVPLARSFGEGLRTIRTSPDRLLLLLTTVGIWGLYAVVAWLPFRMIGVEGLSLVDGWCVMMLGALGLLVPSPGGVGSYHYVTIQTLTLLYGLSEQDAAAYAVLGHGAQFVLYLIVGALSLVVMGRSLYRSNAPADGSPLTPDRSAKPFGKDPAERVI